MKKIIFLSLFLFFVFTITAYALDIISPAVSPADKGPEVPVTGFGVGACPTGYSPTYIGSATKALCVRTGKAKCAFSDFSLGTNSLGVFICVKCPSGQQYDSFTSVCSVEGKLQTGKLNIETTTGFTPSVHIPCTPIAGGECPDAAEGIAQYIARIYQFSLMVVGLLALAGLIFGAVKYILSAGNIVSQEDARDQIKASIIGLLILLGAYLILRTINPALVTLKNPTILKVERVQDTTGGTPAKQSNLPSK